MESFDLQMFRCCMFGLKQVSEPETNSENILVSLNLPFFGKTVPSCNVEYLQLQLK